MATAAHITSIPQELLDQIIHFTYPGSHLQLACTSKSLFRACGQALQRHKEAHEQHRIVCDLQPTTVPTLLRKVFDDPIAAWHMRSFESWWCRRSWDNWKEIQFHSYGDAAEGGETAAYSYEPGEVDRYLDYLRETLGFPEAEVTRAWEEIQRGCDGVLKLLIFCICRLDSVKYARGTNETKNREDCSLSWLVKTSFLCRANDAWPEGLKALRQVDVGVDSGRPSGPWVHSPATLAALMHLPGLKSVYMEGFWGNVDGDDEEDGVDPAADWALTPGCSSVEHIFMDGSEMGLRFPAAAFLAAPRQLKTLSLRDVDVAQPWQWLEKLAELQSESLESFMIYGGGITSEEYMVSAPEHVQVFPKLRCYYQEVTDVFNSLEVDSDDEIEREDGEEENYWDRSHQSFVDEFPCIMPCCEVIILDDSMLTGSKAKALDDGIVALLEQDSEQNSEIKAIYIDPPHRFDRGPADHSYLKAVAAGKKHGVDIYVAPNDVPREHHLDFPMAPEKYDLATGPYAGNKRRIDEFIDDKSGEEFSHRVFDPYSGQWQLVEAGNRDGDSDSDRDGDKDSDGDSEGSGNRGQ